MSSSWPTADLPNSYYGQDDQKRVVSTLRSTMRRDWLLVIDSADDVNEQDFTQCVPVCSHGSVIITSIRREVADVLGKQGREISNLDSESGKELLLARLPKEVDAASTSTQGEHSNRSQLSQAAPNSFRTKMRPKPL